MECDMLESYLKQETERQKLGIPPLPLSPEQTAEVCQFLESPPAGKEGLLLPLIKNRVSPGVAPAAKVKAEWLAKVARGEATSPVVSRDDAVFLLGTMLGGYNVDPLVEFLDNPELGAAAAGTPNTHLLFSRA